VEVTDQVALCREVSTSEDYEIRYWSKKFGVSPDDVKAAVKKVGNSAAAVEKELRK